MRTLMYLLNRFSTFFLYKFFNNNCGKLTLLIVVLIEPCYKCVSGKENNLCSIYSKYQHIAVKNVFIGQI